MSKTPQTLGIEYEILDLEGDLEGGPVRLQRVVDEEIAHLSGGLFDSLPKVEVPLDSFFPPPERPTGRGPRFDSLAPMAFAPRLDSLYPTAMDAHAPVSAPAASSAGAWKWTSIAASVAIAAVGALVAQRPHAQPHAEAPAAPVQHAVAQAPAPAQAPETAAKPATTAAPAAKPVQARAAAKAPAAPAPAPEKPVETAAAPEAPPPAPTPALAQAPAPEGVSPQRAAIALASAGRSAGSCLEPDDARRTMAVAVTFAPSGQAIRATIEGGPHRGTAAGSCIAQRLRSATVAPFEGPAVTIRTSITVR